MAPSTSLCPWHTVFLRLPIQMTQNCEDIKCLQILAEEDFPLKLLWRADYNSWASGSKKTTAKQRTSFSTAKATSSTQRPQTCTKYYNYIVNETDEEREHRLPTVPRRNWIRQRFKFTVKIIFFDAAIGSKNYALQ